MRPSDLRDATSASTFLALSCVGLFATAPAMAQTPPAQAEQATELEGVTVTDTAIDDEIKVDRVESPKATRALIDTPQTLTVIGDQTIRKQNLLTLRDALATIPGITFGAGEGGGGYGDSINLRGYSANNDITQDGVRDSAQYSRTETFNLQQIEVYNGANTVFNGSGSVGGTINLVTKVPQASDLTVIGGGIGTADYFRGTIDSNVRVNELVAVRLNAVAHRNDFAGRDFESYKRWGLAPSVTIGIASDTSATLQYLHQEDDNIPVYGVPYYRNAFFGGPLPGVDDSDYFGIRNLDKQDITVDQVTLRLAHAFSDTLSVRNLTRWQHVGQDSNTSSPQGAYCLANGITGTGTACTNRGFYTPSGPRGNVRNQDNKLFYNQLDLRAVVTTGPLEHTVVLGGSYSWEEYRLETGNLLRTANGTVVPQPEIAIADPDTRYTGAVNFIRGNPGRGDNEAKAIYLFDTTKIGQHVEVSAGLRLEKYDARFRTDTVSTTVGATLGQVTRGPTQDNSDTLFSYRFGLNYKPIETVSIYASYANSRQPRSATVRLGCGALITVPAVGGAPATTADPCDVGAEKARNYEIGAKADLMDRRLQLTAAFFRNDRTNFSVNTNDPIIPTLPVLDGRSRVDGVAIGASGNISEAWAVFANYTHLRGKVMQSVSDFCLANPGQLQSTTTGTPPVTTVTNACGNSSAVRDPQRGQRLTNTPRNAGSLFTTYTLPFGLQLGYGLTYQGSFTLNNSALAAPTTPGTTALTPVFRSKDYLTHRAFLSFPITDGLTAQVNVQNFTNERYFTNIRNNGWAVPGEARSAVLTVYYSF